MRSLECCVLLVTAGIARGAAAWEIPSFHAPEVPSTGSGSARPLTNIDGADAGDFSGGAGGVAADGRPVQGESPYGSPAQEGGLSSSGGELVGGLGAGGSGAASSGSTTSFQTGFWARNQDHIAEAVEKVHDVFDFIQNVIDVSGGSDGHNDGQSTATGSSSTLPPYSKPTQTANTTNGPGEVIPAYLSYQHNHSYAYSSDPRLMSLDIVAEMTNSSSSENSLDSYYDLFTQQEYDMFLNDPLCFYANIETMYLNASSAAKADAAAPSTMLSPSSTQALKQRQATDADVETASQSAELSSLFASELPSQLWSAHFATPTAASGDVTATATSTTSCAGLDGGAGPVTRYRELKIRGKETSIASGPDTTANEVLSLGSKVVGRFLLGCGVAGIVVVWSFVS